MEPNEIENKLTNWDLFKSYGQFNLYFEAIVAQYRELLIELVRNYYGFVGDWEDPETESVIDSDLQDRLLKIILNDDGAFSIIEKCRACYIDSINPEVKKVLVENGVQPLIVRDSDKLFAVLLFKKAIELVKLRNIIIHTHYEGVIFDLIPIVKLTGSKDAKIAKGYEQRIYEYTLGYLNNINLHLFDFYVYSFKLNLSTFSESETDNFDESDFQKLNNMDFTPPLKKVD